MGSKRSTAEPTENRDAQGAASADNPGATAGKAESGGATGKDTQGAATGSASGGTPVTPRALTDDIRKKLADEVSRLKIVSQRWSDEYHKHEKLRQDAMQQVKNADAQIEAIEKILDVGYVPLPQA